MLYFSLILIACGIFFIIYTAIIKIKNESGSVDKQFNDEKLTDNSDRKSDSRHNVQLDIEHTDMQKREEQSDLSENVEKQTGNSDAKYKDEKISDSFPVVLYEDSSNIIDYNKSESVIDTTLGKYKNIKRIGAGNVEILEDGINFRAGKKLFRFDYNRIADIKSGSNFFVLMIKGSDISRLFLYKKNSILGTKLKQVYNKYFTNVL